MHIVLVKIEEYHDKAKRALEDVRSLWKERHDAPRPTKAMFGEWFKQAKQAAERAGSAADDMAALCQGVHTEHQKLIALYNQREEELKASQVYAEELVKVVKQREDGFEAFAQWVMIARNSAVEIPEFSFGEEPINAFAARAARRLLTIMRGREDDVELARLTEARLALKTVVLVTKTSVPGE